MHNIFKILLITLIISCNNSKEIIINQSNTNYPVIIKSASDNKNDIIRIKFPKKYILKNNSLTEKSFIRIKYLYNNIPSIRDSRIEVYSKKSDRLERVNNNKKKTITSKKSLEYIYYTRHFIDSMKTTQQQFRPYIEKMLKENKDTLHIGTVADFKVKHKELFEKLTKNDSISIRFLDGEKMGERITVPVEW